MKIRNSRKKNRLLPFIGISLAVILFASIGYFVYSSHYAPGDHIRSSGKVNYNNPSDEQVDAGNRTKLETVKDSRNQNTDNQKKGGLFTVRITHMQVSSNELRIRNTIVGTDKDGACRLVLNKSGQNVKKTADIEHLAQISTCRGFDIPLSELESGLWSVDLSVTIDGQTAKATTEIEVQ